MKVLLVNQHISNRGDEAAGKALLRKLINHKVIAVIDILYDAGRMSANEIISVDSDKMGQHIYPIKINKINKLLMMMSFLLPFSLMKGIIRYFELKKEFNAIKNADFVINAPGGVNIGPYMSWRYLWRLYVAVKLKKPLVLYSISFGPIPDNILFKNISLYVLRKSLSLSLRDSQSQKYAEECNLTYEPAIDTAFLDTDIERVLPEELQYLSREKYVVFVPNQLYLWHPYFKAISVESMNKFYADIIELFVKKGMRVVLLPQLYGTGNDSKYFRKILDMTTSDNVDIISDKFNSDIQQAVIDKAEFLVGARYHSIIFALRGKTPFYALSYEHKIEYTLRSLSLQGYSCDLKKVFQENSFSEIMNNIEQAFENRLMRNAELEQSLSDSQRISSKVYSSLDHIINGIVSS